MTDELPTVRDLFAGAAGRFSDVVAAVGADDWERPGLGEWEVRALVAHCLRGATTAADYLLDDDDPRAATPPEIPDAGSYIRAGLAVPGLHESVAARGRQAAAALGPDPAAHVAAEVARAVAAVTAAAPSARVGTPFGTMVLDDYLPTRLTELVTHTDDLCRALGRAPVATDAEVRAVLVSLVVDVDRDHGLALLRATLGREPLEGGFNLWG